MTDEIQEVVVKRVKLREDLNPVQIYMGTPCKPIEPDWGAITHGKTKNNEGYNLVFFKIDGTPITWEQFETLEIAIDQAKAIVGIKKTEWSNCEVEITREDGGISWFDFKNDCQQKYGANPHTSGPLI